ncbi:MAG: hypothetical protein M1608_09840 [Candidatus Omnitrophica bacterium]|nr:hypothetical protein [Candidatus Omnitrophota bacterium]
MNLRPENKRLLDDVLSEPMAEDFRRAMFEKTLRLVRRRRRWRQTQSVAALLVVLGLVTLLIRQQDFTQPPVSPARAPVASSTESSYKLVRTQPLPASAIVRTHPLPAARFLASSNAANVLHTTTGSYHLINDDELLALVAPYPAALVRTGPHTEELVFANPKDQDNFH